MKNRWQHRNIGDLCEVIAGQSPEGKSYNTDGKGMPFYQGKKNFEEKFIGDPTTWTTQVTKIARKGDILMSVRAPVGPVNFVTDEICIGRGLAAIRSKAELNRDFLFYQLLYLQPEIAGKEGAVFASINKSEIAALSIAFAPFPEQQRIVGILDEAFEGIAIAKTNAKKNLQNARALFKSHLQSVFTQRGKGWQTKHLGDLCDVLDNKRKPITKRDRIAGKYPYYGATGVLDHVQGYLFDEPLVLVGEDGAKWESGENTAFAVEGKCWVNNHAHVLRPDRTKLLDNWLIYHLNHSDLIEFVSGLTVPKLNQGTLREIPIPLPPIPEQQRIVKKIDSLREKTQRLESLYQQKLTALEALKKSLLYQAFKGAL
ncbi:MAG: restriction endonuclease subunit S [Candidatus Omnitrophota bacterium]